MIEKFKNRTKVKQIKVDSYYEIIVSNWNYSPFKSWYFYVESHSTKGIMNIKWLSAYQAGEFDGSKFEEFEEIVDDDFFQIYEVTESECLICTLQ
tara:strand:- start:5130 stop:5414 length:285 start_codon:yes stop_codon:yes gene_type:complete